MHRADKVLGVGIGLISRRYRPVHWSPSSKSALAEAELEYVEDHKSFPVYVKFQVSGEQMTPGLAGAVENVRNGKDEPVHLVIWTTTPWTLPANMVQFKEAIPRIITLTQVSAF